MVVLINPLTAWTVSIPLREGTLSNKNKKWRTWRWRRIVSIPLREGTLSNVNTKFTDWPALLVLVSIPLREGTLSNP